MNKCFIALVLAIFLYSLMTPALSISVSFNTENSGKMVLSSSTYKLDKSTSLQESAILGDGEITKVLTASGSGNNCISIASSASGKSADAKMEASGNFRTAASVGAFDDGILIGQDTAMSGSYGSLTYHADSPENGMVISTGFEGEGDLKAGIYAVAGEDAAISGNIESLGVDMLDSERMQIVGSGDIDMSANGLYSLSNGGIGNFGLCAANTKKGKAGSDTSALITGPEYSDDGGNANAYAFTGTKWTTRDPKLEWVLKNDANMAEKGLSAGAVQSAIETAANTWDDASNQNLFADSGLVTLNPEVKADSFDRYNPVNTINWAYSSSACLAYARTWSKNGVALDSDIVFNTKYGWDTNGITGLDVQSIALHEMGHTLGLADLYGKPKFRSDYRQVMHYYTGIKRTLGNGDATGIWNLYQ